MPDNDQRDWNHNKANEPSTFPLYDNPVHAVCRWVVAQFESLMDVIPKSGVVQPRESLP